MYKPHGYSYRATSQNGGEILLSAERLARQQKTTRGGSREVSPSQPAEAATAQWRTTLTNKYKGQPDMLRHVEWIGSGKNGKAASVADLTQQVECTVDPIEAELKLRVLMEYGTYGLKVGKNDKRFQRVEMLLKAAEERNAR